MELREKIDNYLISQGCSISNNYAYIIDNNYDYNKKESEEKVELCGYSIPLNSIMRNNVELSNSQIGASFVFAQYLQEAASDQNNQVFDICDIANKGAVVYYTDFLKYVSDKFKINDSIFENLTNLIGASINSTRDSIDKILTKNQLAQLEAVEKGNAERASMDTRAVAEAARASRVTFSQSFTEAGLISGINTYGRSYSSSTMTQSELNASFGASSFCAYQTESFEKRWANETSINDLMKAISKEVENFNKNLTEILIVKMSDRFNRDVYSNVEDLEKNPLYIDGYSKIVEKLEEKDIPEFKKVMEYYTIDYLPTLEITLVPHLVEDYKKNLNCNYDGIDRKLYEALKPTKEFILPNAQKQFFDIIKAEIDKKKESTKEKYEEEKKLIEDCIYLTDHSRMKLNDVIFRHGVGAKFKKSDLTEKLVIGLITIAVYVFLWWLGARLQGNADPTIQFFGNIVVFIKWLVYIFWTYSYFYVFWFV